MRTNVLGVLALSLLTVPVAAQGRWSVEAGSALVRMNDVNGLAASVEGRIAVDVGDRARVAFGLARWFDPSDTNGFYSWGGIGTEIGVSVRLTAPSTVAVRATGVAHASVGNDGDGTPQVHVGPQLGLRLEVVPVGPFRFFVGAAGHAFVTTDGGIEPGAGANAGIAVRL